MKNCIVFKFKKAESYGESFVKGRSMTLGILPQQSAGEGRGERDIQSILVASLATIDTE